MSRTSLALLLLSLLSLPAPASAGAANPELLQMPAGSFTMGGEGDQDELPAHPVKISHPFMLGTTEVTQGLFEEVMGFNPSATKGRDWRGDTRGGTCAAHGVGPELPVTCVTWDEAVTFCNKLSVRHGRDLAYSARGDQWVWNVDADGFRLPTEAEWEWAASRELATAGEPVCGYANVANVGSVKLSRSLDMRPRVKQTYDCEDGFDGLATAGALGAPPDSGGVRDLLGNVWEWTWDLHAPYPEGEVSDPQRAPVPTRGDRVLRGGSWANPPGDLRVRNRFKGPQDGRSYLVGFRVARTAEVPATDVVSMVGPELAAELSAIRTDFGSAASAPQVAAVWSRSMEVMIRLNHRLEQYYYGLVESGAAEREVDLGLINGTLPGLAWTWGVEGIGVTSEMKAEPWRARAIATPEQADDVFFDLMQFVYGGPHRAHARPWAIWDERNWDYGGCSGLGSGVVADGLVRVDEALAAGPGFEVPIGEVRADALRAILKDNPLFPYCDGGSFEPTKDEALRDEVRRILKTVRLTDAEKATLEARIPELKGAEFTGG